MEDWADLVESKEEKKDLVELGESTNPIDFETDGVFEMETENPGPKACNNNNNNDKPLPTRRMESPHVILKKELHHILNCFQLKDRHPHTLHISENFRDPRYYKLNDYLHSMRDNVSSLADARRSIGNMQEPVSAECRKKFIELQAVLGNLTDRIANVIDMVPKEVKPIDFVP